jgi:hypothetical protein
LACGGVDFGQHPARGFGRYGGLSGGGATEVEGDIVVARVATKMAGNAG